MKSLTLLIILLCFIGPGDKCYSCKYGKFLFILFIANFFFEYFYTLYITLAGWLERIRDVL